MQAKIQQAHMQGLPPPRPHQVSRLAGWLNPPTPHPVSRGRGPLSRPLLSTYKQYLGMRLPMIPLTMGPVWMPTRMDTSCWLWGISTCHCSGSGWVAVNSSQR